MENFYLEKIHSKRKATDTTFFFSIMHFRQNKKKIIIRVIKKEIKIENTFYTA